MLESPLVEVMIESPVRESPVTRAMIKERFTRDYVAGKDKYLLAFDPAALNPGRGSLTFNPYVCHCNSWSCSCGVHMKDEGYDDDGYNSPFDEDHDPFGGVHHSLIEGDPSSEVYDFYRYVDGNPDYLELPDVPSGNLDAFMPLFAQIALDTYRPFRRKDGPVKLYFVKMGNVCSSPETKGRPEARMYHFNFWATYLGPDDNVDPTELSPNHPLVWNFYAEVFVCDDYGLNRFNVRRCYEVDEEHDKVDYGCNVCADSNFKPPVLHRYY
ncbi:hypothetical protein Tsubulata_015367 [Turnera subulata]|uniref:Uncharacterized protein n=1 Tax=Turnera subulata TaxID=218843 RepID=A0A9Q0GFC2_9ROSI|nr:hypothetical protein Tsubulata_015367 [Turnera subulata]